MRRSALTAAVSLAKAPPARLLLGVALLMAGGCRAAEPSTGAPTPALHWPVDPPAAMEAGNPRLWVALAARLGPPSGTGAEEAPPLRLRAATGGITLTDPAGRSFSGPALTLHWRWQELPTPFVVRRLVAGPFASFESAEDAAARWRAVGVSPLIAKPKDWEVWAPADAPAPAALAVRSVERRQTQRLVLELRRPEGTVTLEGPLRLEAPGGLLWKGGTYGGPFRLQGDAHGGWTLVEQVPLERYLEGVVPHEIGAGSPPAALTAQAVLARTWAVRNRHRFTVDGYHLCSDTQCQVYSDPTQAGAAVRRAIAASRHQVLALGGQPIDAVYHATNGGVAAGFEEVWNGQPRPYLRAFADGPSTYTARFPIPLPAASLPTLLREGGAAYGADHPRFRWRRLLSAAAVGEALERDGKGVGTPLGLKVLERGPSGRVLALEIRGTAGTRDLRLDAIRRTLRQLPSTLFTVTPAGTGLWQVEGGGFGHGAGLSQAGAIDLAGRGWDTAAILAHYYPGTSLGPLESLDRP